MLRTRSLLWLMVAAGVMLALAPAASAAVSKVICIPWQADPLRPHTTISGVPAAVMAVVKTTDASTVSYSCNFGDGSPAAVGNLGGSTEYNVALAHTYTGAVGQLYVATLTVTNPDLTFQSATFLLTVEADAQDARVNMAIDRGLWWLFVQRSRSTVAGRTHFSWSALGYYSETPSAVLAFEVNGHKAGNDFNKDPYAEAVAGGLNWMFDRLAVYNITGSPSDTNSNGRAVYLGNQSHSPYQTGIFMDAIIATGTPSAIAATGPAGVVGQSYRDIIQDMCDVYAWGIYADGNYGGWRYTWGEWPDNSASQWAAIGLLPAQDNWSCTVPQALKTANNNWLNYSYSTDGTNGWFGYTSPGYFVWAGGMDERPSGMVQMVLSTPNYKTDTRWVRCMNWHANPGNWNAFVNTQTHYYGWFAFVKSMRLSNTDIVGSGAGAFNWYSATTAQGSPVNGLAARLVSQQQSGGYWPGNDNDYGFGSILTTAWSINMLKPSLFAASPIARFVASPTPTYAGFPILFDPSSSGHSDPSKSLVKYEWDWFNTGTFTNASTTPQVVTFSFPSNGTYPVTLRVTDNSVPPLTATYTLNVVCTVPPFPPAARPGGPYLVSLTAGDGLKLDGSASVDPDLGQHEPGSNPPDVILSFDWSLSGGGTFNDAHGPIVNLTPAQVQSFFGAPGLHHVGLQVTDNTAAAFPSSGQGNLSGVFFTTVTTYAAGPVLSGALGHRQVNLTWDVAGSYELLRSTEGPNTGFAKVADVTGAAFADTPLTPGTTYYYRLYRASDETLSNVATVPYTFDFTQWQLITNLRAAAKSRQVQLSWTPVPGAASYRVYRSTTANVQFTPANLIAPNVVSNVASYLDKTVVNGRTYYYRVVIVAASTAAADGISNEVMAKPKSLF